MLPPAEPRGAMTPWHRHRTSVSRRLSSLHRRPGGRHRDGEPCGQCPRSAERQWEAPWKHHAYQGCRRQVTESKQLLDAWQEFLDRNFTCADIPGAAYAPVTADDDNDGEVTEEELESCLRVLHDNKALGCGGIPIEEYSDSPAKQELFAIVHLMWQTKVIPPALVRGTFVMLYKKGPHDNFGNYQAVGLMRHNCKLLSMLVLHHKQDAVEWTHVPQL